MWTGFSTEIVYEDRQEIWGHVWGVDAGGQVYGEGYIVDRCLNKT